MRRSVPIVLTLLFMVGTFDVAAFSCRDHKRIALEAARRVPESLRRLLLVNPEKLGDWACEPDFMKNDSINHVWHPDRQGDEGWGGNLDRIEALAREILEDLRRSRPPAEVVRKFAHLAHYVSDGCQPLHTSQDDPRERSYHEIFEKTWHDLPDEEVFTRPDRARRVRDLRDYQKENARWARQHYDAIGADWAEDQRFDDPATRVIYRKSMNRAVQSVVDVWSTLYARARSQRGRR